MIIDNVLCFISYRLYLLCKSRRKCYVPACLFVYNCVFFDKNVKYPQIRNYAPNMIQKRK